MQQNNAVQQIDNFFGPKCQLPQVAEPLWSTSACEQVGSSKSDQPKPERGQLGPNCRGNDGEWHQGCNPHLQGLCEGREWQTKPISQDKLEDLEVDII